MHLEGFTERLLSWYQKNKRDLPWRGESDAYKIWLSEVILQQTRVAQGMKYYHAFVENYPTVQRLAAASEDEVLKLWQGLGYYSRARNLHAAAKEVANNGGDFPTSFNDLIQLKGVGAYTAAAVASFSSNEAVPVVDGNVKRVISRLFGIESIQGSAEFEKQVAYAVQSFLPKEAPGLFNQAIMEFGALHCTPKKALCDACPFNESCQALADDMVYVLPKKKKKKPVRHRYFVHLVFDVDGKTWLEQRTTKDIWLGLYQFPLIELRESDVEHLDEILASYIKEGATIDRVISMKPHKLSHQTIHGYFVLVNGEFEELNDGLIQVDKNRIRDFAVSQLTSIFIEQYF